MNKIILHNMLPVCDPNHHLKNNASYPIYNTLLLNSICFRLLFILGYQKYDSSIETRSGIVLKEVV
jgi:hypothetical protein